MVLDLTRSHHQRNWGVGQHQPGLNCFTGALLMGSTGQLLKHILYSILHMWRDLSSGFLHPLLPVLVWVSPSFLPQPRSMNMTLIRTNGTFSPVPPKLCKVHITIKEIT